MREGEQRESVAKVLQCERVGKILWKYYGNIIYRYLKSL